VPAPELIRRVAGRVLVLDSAGRVLMLRGFDPARPAEEFWVTIGGGIDAGEGTRDAAARELAEEAGIEAAPAELGEPVWSRDFEFSFDGVRYSQYEEFFLLRVGQVQVSLDGLEEIERATVTGYGWWAADEMEASDELFLPPELPDLLRRVTA
jgi:8-oxo-dGTP pyrophosphatase MutT (NUDIX family)